MKRTLLTILLLLGFGAGAVYGQNTTVTLQVTDANSQSWNNGTYTVSLKPASGIVPPTTYYLAGVPMTQSQLVQTGSLSGSGAATITLGQTNLITPVTTIWQYVVCPQATSSCYTASQTAVGSTQNVTLTPPSISVPALGQTPLVYATSEVSSANIGSQVFVLGTGLYVCTAVNGPTCTSWSTSGTGGSLSGLTANCIPKAATATTITGCSSATDNGTTFSLTEPLSTTGAVTTGSSPPSCGTATGILCMSEGSTAGTPTSGVDYLRADSVTHKILESLNGGAETPIGGSVASGTQCQTTVYTATGTAVGASTIACDASKFSGVDPTGATDSHAGLQNSINAAISANAELYLPAGTYKTSAALTANSTAFRMRGAGANETSITASTTGYTVLSVGPGSVTYVGPSGYIKDMSFFGDGKTNAGYSALQLNGVVQYIVENVTVDTADIGFDLINDCYGSKFKNVRAGFSGNMNAAAYLRTGVQSGSDITFENPWLIGQICGICAAGGGGGYHVFGGQIGVGTSTGSPTDTSASIVLGFDYLTSATGETSMDVHGTSFEPTNYGWAFRSFAQVDLKTYGIYANPANSGQPAIGFFKGTSLANSRISINGTNISGNWSNPLLVSLAGSNPGNPVPWHEFGTYTASSNPVINGTSTYVGSMAAQSEILSQAQIEDNNGKGQTLSYVVNNVYYVDGFTTTNFPGIGVAQTAWSSGTYPLCTAVSHSSLNYLAVGVTTGVTPGTNSAIWYAVQNGNTPTQLDCAFYYALATGIAASAGNVIKLGTGNYTTNIGLIEPTGQVHTDIVGVDKGVNGYPTQITAGAALSYIVYSPPQGGSLPYNFLLSNISFNGGGLVTGGCIEIQGQKAGVIEHIYCSNWNYTSGSAIPVWLGSAGSYQLVVDDIFVAGPTNGNPSATITASGTGSSLTFSIGSFTYYNAPINAQLNGYSNGTKPCATMGTLSTTYTGSVGSYTLTGINMSGFSGCTGPYYVYVPDVPANQVAIEVDAVTDSTLKDLIVANDGWKYGIFYNGSSADVAVHEHVYAASQYQIVDGGNDQHYGTEIDTPAHIGIGTGGNARWTDTLLAQGGGAAPVAGVLAFSVGSGTPPTTQFSITNFTCPNSSTSGNYFALAQNSSGPIAHGAYFGSNINVVNAEECDTLTYENSTVSTLTVPATVTYGAAAGSANAYTLASNVPVLSTGLHLQFLPNAGNTSTTPTLNVNSLSAKTITKYGTAALSNGDLTTTAIADVIYDGTDFELQNPQTASSGNTATGCTTGCNYVLTTADEVVAGNASNAGLVTSNQPAVIQFYNNIQRKLGNGCINISTSSASGHLDVGVYSSTGSLLWHSGSLSTTTAGATCFTPTGITLSAATNYYIAMCADNTTAKVVYVGGNGSAPGTIAVGATAHTWGYDATDTCTTGVLPATITTTNITNNSSAEPPYIYVSN